MNGRNDPTHAENATATILAVDDEPANLALLHAVLKPFFNVRVARSGEDALRAVASAPAPDLVLLDVMMPDMDGYTVLNKLRASPAHHDIPVIFVTALADSASEQHGLELGAVDYITKPISPPIVLARIRTQLALKAAKDHLSKHNARLESLVLDRTQALKRTLEKVEEAHATLKQSYFGTLMAISALAELRAPAISEHSRHVADVSRQLATALGLSSSEVQDIFVAALLHDIGKIGFSDDLLLKPVGTMHADELASYREHPALAADALAKIDALTDIAAIVRYHHEHYDGSGFPEGRSGLDIPLGARIIAAVSDYDDLRNGALTAAPMTKKESHRYLVEGRGHRYDPEVIDHLEPLLKFDKTDEIDEIRVTAGHLQEGMLLTRDVLHPDGFLLLSKGTVLAPNLISQLASAERNSGREVEIFVLRQRVGH